MGKDDWMGMEMYSSFPLCGRINGAGVRYFPSLVWKARDVVLSIFPFPSGSLLSSDSKLGSGKIDFPRVWPC